MNFEENIDIKYKSLEETTIFLKNKNIDINILLFDKFINLKRQNSTNFSKNSSIKLCIFLNNEVTLPFIQKYSKFQTIFFLYLVTMPILKEYFL